MALHHKEDNDMDALQGLQWMLQNTGETLLLVAVDPSAANTPGAWPCQVVGGFTPSSAFTPPAPAPQTDAQRVSRLLSEIGVPGNLTGCTYLRTALTLLLQEPSLGRAVTRRLYPRVASVHQTTASGVEKAIRHAISQTFARVGTSGYRTALGRLASSVGDRPTNAEFLAQAAERLRLGA